MNNTAIKFTYQDYLQITDDLNRHEIIDGEHYVTPSPMKRHQAVSINLATLIHQWVRDKNMGSVFSAPFDVVLSNSDVVVPDLLFISKDRLSIVNEKNVKGAPDLVVEILSPSTSERDLGIKKTLYEKYGVKEYWVIDPDKQTIVVFTLTGTRFSSPKKLSSKDTLSSILFSGLQIPVSSLF
ncbi:MAG: Uma2 family endonuclease [Nitrospiria bacterium]